MVFIGLSAFIFSKFSKKLPKKNIEIAEDEDQDQEGDMMSQTPSKLSGYQTYVTASELRQHLRTLWTNDKELLRHLFKALSLNATDWSTDIFFLDVVPVPPSRFRPVSNIQVQQNSLCIQFYFMTFMVYF